MRPPTDASLPYQKPALLDEAIELANYLASLSVENVQTCMRLSESKAAQTVDLLKDWSVAKTKQRPAIDAFLGDIYSGLQVQAFSDSDRDYANEHLLILSGLYGGLRALDSIYPYRLEMGYRLPDDRYTNLVRFWGTKIAELIPKNHTVINLSAVEYTNAVLPHIDNPVITPKFLTISPKTGEPVFVTVHAKIARGAFAHWMITNRIEDVSELKNFNELGYECSGSLSKEHEPVFVCKTFKGLGLSVRLS